MENFFSWMTKPLTTEEVEIWFNMNNIIPEKNELFYDFCLSLISLIKETYLGEQHISVETKIIMSEIDKLKHFDWCWKRTIDNFNKENIFFNEEGEHYEYFKTFLMEVFYNQQSENVRNSLDIFLKDLFNRDTPFTKSDLDLMTEVYKLLDSNINY